MTQRLSPENSRAPDPRETPRSAGKATQSPPFPPNLHASAAISARSHVKMSRGDSALLEFSPWDSAQPLVPAWICVASDPLDDDWDAVELSVGERTFRLTQKTLVTWAVAHGGSIYEGDRALLLGATIFGSCPPTLPAPGTP